MERATDLDALLQEIVDNGGTDLHLSVGSVPRYRRYGKMTTMNYAVLDDRAMEELVFNKDLMDLQLRTNLNTVGQVDLSYSIASGTRFRVNVFRQKGSIAAVFRTLPSDIPDYMNLGLPLSVFNLYKKRRGLILIVGPTGSGKTTTLASFLSVINKNTYKHIITLEDPIEYVHWHARSLINQREIGTDCDSFAYGLRAALREDPDVILVGEMRDLETIATAITAAETGHLVFSTLHTIGAASTIDRIIDVFPAHQQEQIRIQLAMVLEAVISQQLIPRTDKGRVAAFEVMHATIPIKNLIRESKTFQIQTIIQTSRKAGMITMDDSLIDLCHREIISESNAIEFAQNEDYVEKRVSYVI